MMKCKLITACIALLLMLTGQCLFAQVLMPTIKGPQNVQLLNGQWKFKYIPGADTGADSVFYKPDYNLSNWAAIKVPGNWEMQGFAEPLYGKKLKEGTGLYRRNFAVSANWAGTPIYIAFDGVNFGYTFWINGKLAGQFASSYNRQTFDVSKFIIPGKTNSIAVKVTTHPKGWEFDTNDDWSLSGISRDVILFSLPAVHIKDVTVQTFVRNAGSGIGIKAIVEKSLAAKLPADMKLSGELLDPSGKQVASIIAVPEPVKSNSAEITFNTHIDVQNARLWSAEHPDLYTLNLSVKSNNTVLQQYTDRVGIREVSWDKGVLKLNGQAIKLKGATHHDLSPVNGRSISEAEMKQDLKLMHQANINFIRTSHYPPNARLLSLCDSLGFYVMDEVPFGYGDEHLEDTTYMPNLLQRAKLTIWRDKNRPSVIIWSVGNENPATQMDLKVGRYVKRLDSTRPYCLPQTPGVFNKMLSAIPDSLDLLDDHYPKVADLERYAPKLDRPMVASEYSHALGLDFGSMEAIFETMCANPHLAGGAVWEFFDQGLLRRSSKKISPDDATYYAWLSPDSCYDTQTNEGTDGIVYANRVPQVDYWQVRKVYTPVKAMDDTLIYHPGTNTFAIHVNNRYDFTNLNELTCKWQLMADTTAISSGIAPMAGGPHSAQTINISVSLPDKALARYYYLKIAFEDKAHYQFYEKTYPLKGNKPLPLLQQTAVNVKPTQAGNVITTANYRFELNKETGKINLKNSNGDVIIADGLYARVGRKRTMTEEATTTSKRSKVLNTLWMPFILTKPEVQVRAFDARQLTLHCKYQPEPPEKCMLEGDITYTFTDNGAVQVNYNFIPQGKGQALEAGVSFLIPATFTQFRWVGKGPYAAYPGKDRLSEFGIYQINSNDLYFSGNRQQVDCAVFSNNKGAGLALMANNANISVEHTADGILVSHNAQLSGRFNKYEWPETLYAYQAGQAISGSFTLLPLNANWPKALTDLFGNATKTVKGFHPFYHSYDQ